MCKWTVCVLLFGLFLQALATIVIKEMSGADSAELGSNTTAIKCVYDYDDNETGMEIKWFYNNNVQIYLWIPERSDPVAMGPFKDMLEVDNDTIHFKEITRNLTGSYTCKVSSDVNEKTKTEVMVVYQPATKVEFYSEETSETVICAAYDLFPKPNITIVGRYISGSNESIPILNEDEEVKEDDVFNITKTVRVNKEALQDSVEFTCKVFIPHTTYNETRRVPFDKPMRNESTIDDYDYRTNSTETSINSTTINSATINSTTINPTKSTIQGAFAPSSAPSKWLMVVAAIMVVGWKR